MVPYTSTILGAVFFLSLRAATNSFLFVTLNTFCSVALAPPVVPLPTKANPSCFGRTSRIKVGLSAELCKKFTIIPIINAIKNPMGIIIFFIHQVP